MSMMSWRTNDTKSCHPGNTRELPRLYRALCTPGLMPPAQSPYKVRTPVTVPINEEDPAGRWQRRDSNSALTLWPHCAEGQTPKQEEAEAVQGLPCWFEVPPYVSLKGLRLPPHLARNRTKRPGGVSYSKRCSGHRCILNRFHT